MLALQIDDPIIEENLKARFSSPQKLKNYIVSLISKDIEHKKEDISENKVDGIFGILQAKNTVSLEQMDEAIRSRGSHFDCP
jgi:hypothetical protein